MNNINPCEKLNISNLTLFAKKIVVTINKIRLQPKNYLNEIKSCVKINPNKNNVIEIFGRSFNDEGLSSLIKLLKYQEDLNPLKQIKGLNLAAEDLMKVLILREGISSMIELDNHLKIFQRTNRYGKSMGEICEIIDIGNDNIEAMIFNLLLSNKDRNKFRKIIFHPHLKFIGAFCDYLPSYKICSVLNFAEDYFEFNEKIPKSLQFKFNPEVYEKRRKENQLLRCFQDDISISNSDESIDDLDELDDIDDLNEPKIRKSISRNSTVYFKNLKNSKIQTVFRKNPPLVIQVNNLNENKINPVDFIIDEANNKKNFQEYNKKFSITNIFGASFEEISNISQRLAKKIRIRPQYDFIKNTNKKLSKWITNSKA